MKVLYKRLNFIERNETAKYEKGLYDDEDSQSL